MFFHLQPEEKNKFDGIFESLSPVNGLLSGEKVKPVLINSKLPLDVLGKVFSIILLAVRPCPHGNRLFYKVNFSMCNVHTKKCLALKKIL